MFDEFGDPIDTMGSDMSGDTGGGSTSSDFPDSGGPASGGLGGLIPAGLFSKASPGKAAVAGMYGVGKSIGRGFGAIMLAGGRSVSVKKLWEVAKKYGPEVAAAVVGYSVADLMAVFASSGVVMASTRHRRRGISSRDIRTTKRVVNFVNRMSEQIGCVHRPHFARHRARRA